MSFTPQSVIRNQENRIGKIIQSDSSTQSVIMQDRFGGQFQISLHLHDSIATMPAVGEVWMVKRIGIDWVLDKRLEDGTESIPFKDLAPGDRRIDASNDLYLAGSNIYLTGPITARSELVLDKPLNPKYIEGSPVNGDVITTVNGISSWAAIPSVNQPTQLLYSQVISGTQASFDATLTSNTYTNLQIVCLLRGDTSGGTTDALLRLNSDTGSNYDYSIMTGTAAGVVSGLGSAAASSISLAGGTILAASNPANKASTVTINIPFYKNTSFHKSFNFKTDSMAGAAASNMFTVNGSGLWRSTSAISTIKIYPLAGNWSAGSSFYVYGSI